MELVSRFRRSHRIYGCGGRGRINFDDRRDYRRIPAIAKKVYRLLLRCRLGEVYA